MAHDHDLAYVDQCPLGFLVVEGYRQASYLDALLKPYVKKYVIW